MWRAYHDYKDEVGTNDDEEYYYISVISGWLGWSD